MPHPTHMSTIGALEVERGAGFVEVRRPREQSMLATFAVAATAVTVGGFVAIVLPTLPISRGDNAILIGVGLAAIAVVGGLAFLRGPTATLRLDAVGIAIEQGTPLAMRRDAIAWADLAGAEVEAVDERRVKRGVQLRLARRSGGKAIDALPGVGVAELTEVRRMVYEAWRALRADAPR